MFNSGLSFPRTFGRCRCVCRSLALRIVNIMPLRVHFRWHSFFHRRFCHSSAACVVPVRSMWVVPRRIVRGRAGRARCRREVHAGVSAPHPGGEGRETRNEMKLKRAHPDLNQGPADLRSAALTTELCTQLEATAALHLIAFWNVDPLAQDGCLFAKFEANP